MKRVFKHLPTIALLTLAATGLLFTAGAADRPKPPTDTPVTSSIDGSGVDNLPALRIQSDGVGSYRNSTSMSSILQAALGDWELDMVNFTSSPQRKALIDFRDPVAGSGPNGGAPTAPFTYQFVRARFIAKCAEFGGDMRTIPNGGTIYCPLAVLFNDPNGVQYRLNMNSTHFPEVNNVQITCVNANASAQCNQWRIEPTAFFNGERKNVAKLLKLATSKQNPEKDLGDFYLSFTINVTNP
jgi:hypothetical protein